MVAEQLDQAVGGDNRRNKKNRDHVCPADPADSRSVVEPHVNGQGIADDQYENDGNDGYFQSKKNNVGPHQLIGEQVPVIGQIIAA